ncbi:PH domain-containing protein [Prauserella marina]|uniref:PH domain-containing protein n=1 Tax=Prauserella marina TaxID=530584 RepID=UPI003B8473AE
MAEQKTVAPEASPNPSPTAASAPADADEPAGQDRKGGSVNEGRKAIFRIPATSLLTIVILLFCITPAAFAAPGLQALYLFPVALTVWIIRIRTTATSAGLTVRTVFSTRELPWTSLKALAITRKSRVQAVLTDGTKVTLPTVRTRHLPVLSLVSDGLVSDPSGVLAEPETEKNSGERPEPEPDARQGGDDSGDSR